VSDRYFNPAPKKLTKRPRAKKNPRRKPRVDIAGLVPASDWWQLKILVLARPQGGEAVRDQSGAWVLVRAGLCERCGLIRATDAHHRWLTAEGGPDVASNLAALCRRDHDWCHANPVEARGSGFIVESTADHRSKAMLLWDGSLVLLSDDAGYSYIGYPK
jgi:hypothetical protein